MTLIVRGNYNNDIRIKSAKHEKVARLGRISNVLGLQEHRVHSNRQRAKEISGLQTAIHELQFQINELNEYK